MNGKALMIITPSKPSAPPLSSPEGTRDPGDVTSHASDGECGTCRYYSSADGRCLRFPPHGTEWSSVNEEDWCGEYEAGPPRKAESPQEEASEPEGGDYGTGARI